MTNHRRSSLFGFSVLMALTALGPLPGCSAFGPAPSFDDGTGSSFQSLCLSCASDFDCSVFDACIEGGRNVCRSGTCGASYAAFVNYACVQSAGGCVGGPPPMSSPDAGTPWTPPSSTGCGTVDAPTEQVLQGLGARTHCNFITVRPTGARYEFGWLNVVADAPGGSIEIMRGNILGVRYDGTIVPIQGSALGQRPFTWAGLFMRSPTWFGGSDAHSDVPLPAGMPYYTFAVPTDRVLHIVLGGVDVSAYREAYIMVQARTTGDVRYQVGLDYDSDTTVSPGEVRSDGGMSDWGRCSDGSPLGITLSSPISTEPTFCGYRPIVTSPPPPPSGSRDFVAQLGPSFPDSCPSGWIITVWAPSGDNLVGPSIRDARPADWPAARSSLTMACGSPPTRWMNWDAWSGRTVADISGFGTLTMCGADIRSLVSIGHDLPGDGVRPLIYWGDVRGSCR